MEETRFENHMLAPLLAKKPVIMGVVNVTPDSFSDGGDFYNYNKAIEHGLSLFRNGAAILDIGGESTRPGAQPVEVEEEIERVVPVVKALSEDVPYLSVDTRNAETMRAALNAGANIINDISALTHDDEALNVIVEYKVPVCLMHMQGEPKTMQDAPSYKYVVTDIIDYFSDLIKKYETFGLSKNQIVLDPGIGFGKTLEHNLLILSNIKEFHKIGCPLLLGVSRKSFIGKLCGDVPASERLPGSLAAALWGVSQAVQIFRVHDVAETAQAFKVFTAISDYLPKTE